MFLCHAHSLIPFKKQFKKQFRILFLLFEKMFLKIVLLSLLLSYAMASLVISPNPDGPVGNSIRFADKIVCDVVVAQWLQEGSCSFYDYCTTRNSIVLANWTSEPDFECKIYTEDPSYYVV